MFCATCGGENTNDAQYCAKCGAQLAAPSPQVPGVKGASAAPTEASTPRLASLGDRLIALILDTLVLVAVFAVAGMWSAVRWGGVTASGFEVSGKPALITFGVVLLFGFLYYWLLEGLLGATLGKGIIGIRVRDLSGARCSLAASLVRNILRLIDAFAVYLVGFLIAVFSKKRQRLGDHLAHTVVVEAEGGIGMKAALVVVWLGLLGGGIWGAYRIHRTAPAASTASSTSSSTLTSSTASTTSTSPPTLASGTLQVINFAFLQSKDGPPRPDGPFKPGDKVFTKYEFTGFTTDAQGQIHLVDTVVPLDPNGMALYKPYQDTTDRALGETKSAPVSFWFDIPRFAPPGTYKVQIKAHDNVKNLDVEHAAPFTVEGPQLPVSTRLEIRDLQFSLSEGGPALNPMVASPGATIYMSGNVAGIQFRDDRADVRIAFVVLGPKGEKLLDQPDFITFNDAFIYHPPTFYIPVSGHLSLPSGADKGTYTEKYVLTDAIANTTANYELKFEVQ